MCLELRRIGGAGALDAQHRHFGDDAELERAVTHQCPPPSNSFMPAMSLAIAPLASP